VRERERERQDLVFMAVNFFNFSILVLQGKMSTSLNKVKFHEIINRRGEFANYQ
jgi:hypothetical protein